LFEEVRKKITEKVERFQKDKSFAAGNLARDLRASLGKRVRSETFRAALENWPRRRSSSGAGRTVKERI